MLCNSLGDASISGIRRFIFLDSKMQKTLNTYPKFLVSDSIIVAIDYLFPGLTKKNLWWERDKFPYKEILSYIGNLLYKEISELLGNTCNTSNTNNLIVNYLGDIIIIDIEVEER